MTAVLESLFNIRREEQKKALLMLLYSTCLIAGAFIIGRTVASTLFLKRIDPAYLPLTYVASALFVSIGSIAYSRVEDILRRDRVILLTFIVFTVLTLAFRFGLLASPQSIILMGGLFVLVEVMGTIGIVQFWTFANDVFTTREGKRLFAFIGAGGTIAQVVFGGLVKTTVKSIGAPNLLFVMAGLFFFCIFILGWLGKIFDDRLEESRRLAQVPSDGRKDGKTGGNLMGDFKKLLKSNQLVTVTIILIVTSLVVVLIDYQFMITARSSFETEESLAGFFGMFYLVAGSIAFFFQFFLTGRLLERFGILFALMFLPVALIIMSAGVLLDVSRRLILYTIAGAKGADNVVRYSINNPTMNLLYLPVSADFRSKAKALIDGIIKPVAIGFSGLMILGLTVFLDARQLSYITIPLIVVWMVLVVKARSNYMQALADTIRRKKLDLFDSHLPVDDNTVKALEKALSEGKERDAFNALELLPAIPDRDWDPMVANLLVSKRPAIRQRALQHLGRQGNGEYAGHCEKLFDDTDPEVCAAAIAAFAAIKGEEGIEPLVPYIKQRDPVIKSAAVASLIHHGGLDGILTAAEELKNMLIDPDPGMRLAGAKVLEVIEVRQFHKPLLPLLEDGDVKVKNAAIKAAGAMKSPALIAPLIKRLSEHRTARSAGAALAGYGESVCEELKKALYDKSVSNEGRLRVVKVLRRIGTQQCLDILIEAMDSTNEDIRSEASSAVARMTRSNPLLSFPEDRMKELLHKEVNEYYRKLLMMKALSGKVEPLLLGEALQSSADKTAKRALDILSALHPDQPFDSIGAGLVSKDTATRSNSVELLDNILVIENKKALLAMFEDGTIDQKLKAAKNGHNSAGEEGPASVLTELCSSENPWTRALAIHEIGRMKLSELAGLVEDALRSRDLLVKESAVKAIAKISDGEKLKKLLAPLADDETETIRMMARSEMGIA